eukprot:TRINITY_DN46006_c0_g1_i1.p1 TRINITY_DN46006_c0_g1~~TRINITY_DN46006_c0_g1_i1.p1  ORF type:complete len:282 (+),score=56.89 TRINITY_DN46006_c0_g1_i1:85-846(+)
MAAGLIVYVSSGGGEPRALELPPDATVGDLLAENGTPRGVATFGGRRLGNAESLADAGVSNEARVDVDTANPLALNRQLPHDGCKINEDGTEVEGDFKTGTVTLLCCCPIAPTGETTWAVRVLSYSNDAYFGMGITPMVEDPKTLTSQRIANDSTSTVYQGIGASVNQNGSSYGAWVSCTESAQFGCLKKDDQIRFTVTMPQCTVKVDLTVECEGSSQAQKTTILRGDFPPGTTLYPAVFLQYGKGTRLKLVP